MQCTWVILEKEEEKVGDEDYIEEMIAKRAQAKKDMRFCNGWSDSWWIGSKRNCIKRYKRRNKVVKSLISGNMEENKILGEHSDLFQIIKDTMELKDIDIN